MPACRTAPSCVESSLQDALACTHPVDADKVSQLAQLQQRCILQSAPSSITETFRLMLGEGKYHWRLGCAGQSQDAAQIPC